MCNLNINPITFAYQILAIHGLTNQSTTINKPLILPHHHTADVLSYYEQQAILISKQVKLNALRLAITVLLVDYEGKLIHAPLRLISDTVINDSKSAS